MDEPLTAHDYRPEVLDEAMGHSDYPLQALLYTVVLHRFLRWRLPGYDPAAHLGGVLYLYLRGMCGPGHAGRRRGAVRGVLLASAGRAGRGAVRPARRDRVASDERHLRAGRRPRPRLAPGADGLLARFNVAGVLDRGRRPRRHPLGRLGGEADERVLLAVALAVRAVRRGSVCLDLAAVPERRARPALARARRLGRGRSAAATGRRRRGALEHGLLYLDRYHQQETQVLDDLAARVARSAPMVDETALAPRWRSVPGAALQREQRAAAAGRRPAVGP